VCCGLRIPRKLRQPKLTSYTCGFVPQHAGVKVCFGTCFSSARNSRGDLILDFLELQRDGSCPVRICRGTSEEVKSVWKGDCTVL
jgi:hypothetical protein